MHPLQQLAPQTPSASKPSAALELTVTSASASGQPEAATANQHPLEAFLAGAVAPYAPGADRTQQDELKAEWLSAYRPWVDKMKEIEGDGFRLDRNAQTRWRQALLEAVIVGIVGFFSSFFRTPIGNVVAAALAPKPGTRQHPGELSTRLDADVFGAAASALLASLATYSVLLAIVKVARAHNLPVQEAVDSKTLFPPASRVQAEPVYGADGRLQHVRFYKLASNEEGPAGDVPAHMAATTVHDLERNRDRLRRNVDIWHATYAGTGYAVVLQPFLTGAANAGRRAGSSLSFLKASSALFFLGGLASGSAGAIAKGGLTALKGLPRTGQVRVPNPIGGTRWCNMTKYDVPRTGQPLAGWNDARGLPRAVKEVGIESWNYLSHLVTHPSWQLLQDFIFRFFIPNEAARTASTVYAASMLQLARGGSLLPVSGESPKSTLNIAQQFLASMFNEYVNTQTQAAASKMKVNIDGDMQRVKETGLALRRSLDAAEQDFGEKRAALRHELETYLLASDLPQPEKDTLHGSFQGALDMQAGPALQRELRDLASRPLPQPAQAEAANRLREAIERLDQATARFKPIESRLSVAQRLKWWGLPSSGTGPRRAPV